MIFGLRTKIAVGALALAGAFGSGWAVNGWRHDASDARELRDSITALQNEQKRLKEFNDAAAKREQATLASVAEMNTAIGKLLNEVHDLDMGACRFTPDSDRLRSEAHRQAFPSR